VSVPKAISHIPAATAAADPPEDPPAEWARDSRGVVPGLLTGPKREKVEWELFHHVSVQFRDYPI
jgi:hypothetical protein